MPERKNIDFSLVVTKEDLAKNAKSRIAFLTGLQPSQVDPDEMRDLSSLLTLASLQPYGASASNRIYGFYEKYIQKSPEERQEEELDTRGQYTGTEVNTPTPSNRTIGERTQAFRQRSEIFINPENTHYLSYGISAPSYYKALSKQRNAEKVSSTHRSLLVGALTPETVSEYVGVTTHVFPNADLHVVDIEGDATRKACEANDVQWHQGDCLAMPFAPSSFDSVQSDFLFDQIRSPLSSNTSQLETIAAYFQQLHNILKPHGQLISVDNQLNREILATASQSGSDIIWKTAKYKNNLKHVLRAAGFKDIAIEPLIAFSSRSELDKEVMLGNRWDFPKKTTSTFPGWLITAVKP